MYLHENIFYDIIQRFSQIKHIRTRPVYYITVYYIPYIYGILYTVYSLPCRIVYPRIVATMDIWVLIDFQYKLKFCLPQVVYEVNLVPSVSLHFLHFRVTQFGNKIQVHF
mgnify:CR=1 FL=1